MDVQPLRAQIVFMVVESGSARQQAIANAVQRLPGACVHSSFNVDAADFSYQISRQRNLHSCRSSRNGVRCRT